jgi:hypothetical protein
VPLPVYAYLAVCVRTPIVVSYVVPYALVVCVITSPIARSNRTPRLVDHRLMTLIKQMEWMLGRAYRSGCCAQNDCDRKSNVYLREHHLIFIWRGIVDSIATWTRQRARIMLCPEVTRFCTEVNCHNSRRVTGRRRVPIHAESPIWRPSRAPRNQNGSDLASVSAASRFVWRPLPLPLHMVGEDWAEWFDIIPRPGFSHLVGSGPENAYQMSTLARLVTWALSPVATM